MEQSLWRSSEKREKSDLLFLRNFLTQKATGFGMAQNNSLAFGSLRYFAWKRYNQPSLFAKISNVIANRTFPKESERPSFLAKISDACHKSSLFLRMKEASLFAKISDVIANRTFPKESEGPCSLARISDACQKSSALLVHEINYGKRDKNKIIY